MPLTILLADDSMTAQNMGKKILTEAGYEVVAVSNGAAAVKKIAERRPDLAVLDVYMPGYTGLEVCERLKSAQETNAMPVLLTVGKMEPFKAEEGSRVKADGLIIKPFEATDLLAAVQKLEEKLSLKGRIVATPATPDEIPEYERTIKISAPVIDEADESYQAWKAETPEHSPEHSEGAGVAPGMTAAPAAPAFQDELEHAPSQHTTTSFTAPTEEIAPQEILPPGEAGARGGMKGLLSKAKGWFGGASEAQSASEAAGEAAPQEAETPTAASAVAAETMALGSAAEPMRHFENAAAQRITEPLERPAHLPEFESPPAASAFAQDAREDQASAHDRKPALAQEHQGDEWGTTKGVEAPASSWSEPAAPDWAAAETPEASLPAAEAASAPPSSFEPALPVSGFEPTAASPESAAEAAAGADPALITDAAEMAAAFPTKFGIEGAEPVHVGIASEFPQLYDDVVAQVPPESQPAEPASEIAERGAEGAKEAEARAEAPLAAAAAEGESAKPEVVSDAEFDRRVAEALETGWKAEPAELEAHEHGVALHEEMQSQAAAQSEAPVEPQAAPAQSAQAEAPAGPSADFSEKDAGENAPDHELAAAMAAAVGSHIEPAVSQALSEEAVGDSTMPLDQHTAMVAAIVHRVTERLKPNLVAEIARELSEELKRKRGD